MRKGTKKKVAVTLAAFLIAGSCIPAQAQVYGHLDVTYHILPVLEDTAWAFTTIDKPSKKTSQCAAKMTAYAYNKKGTYHKASHTYSGSDAWDPPINSGAFAKIRAIKRAKGTHKAKSYDTGQKWVSTSNTSWKK